MYSSCHLQPLIIEYVISMATTSIDVIECKMLSISEMLDIINKVDAI